MPAPLTVSRALTSWTADWPTLVAAAALLGWYLTAQRGQGWPVRRTVSWVGGVGVLVLTTCSFLGVYDRSLFWVRAVQNVVLLMGVPMLLCLAAPVSLLLRSGAPAVVDRLRRLGASAPGRLLAYPATVTVALLAPLPVVYLTGLYPLTLRSAAFEALVRAVLLGAGLLYYWTRLRVDPVPGNAQHLVSFTISFAEALVDGVLGVIVWLGPPIAAAHYALRDWGPSPHRDQTMGAIALWFGGDLISLIYLGVLFVKWFLDDSRAAKLIDAELDERATSSQVEPEMQDGLWWQTDPRFAHRRDLRDS